MSPRHEKLINECWEAMEYGSVFDQKNTIEELENFEHEGVRNGTIAEKDVTLKYVLLWD